MRRLFSSNSRSFSAFSDMTFCTMASAIARSSASFSQTHFVRSCPLTCCQATPAISQLNSSGVRCQATSFVRGQRKLPLCRRRVHNHTPCLSQRRTLIRERALLTKTKAAPSCHVDLSSSCIYCVSVSMPRRMSTGLIAMKTLSGLSIFERPEDIGKL